MTTAHYTSLDTPSFRSPIHAMRNLQETADLLSQASLVNETISIPNYDSISFKSLLSHVIRLLHKNEENSSHQTNSEAQCLIRRISRLSSQRIQYQTSPLEIMQNCLGECCCCIPITTACKATYIETCLKPRFETTFELRYTPPPSQEMQ